MPLLASPDIPIDFDDEDPAISTGTASRTVSDVQGWYVNNGRSESNSDFTTKLRIEAVSDAYRTSDPDPASHIAENSL